MCTCGYRCPPLWTCMWKPEVAVFLYCLLDFETVSYYTWSSLLWSDCSSAWSVCGVHLPVPHTTLWMLSHQCQRSELRPSCLCSKHFANWAISPAPDFFFLPHENFKLYLLCVLWCGGWYTAHGKLVVVEDNLPASLTLSLCVSKDLTRLAFMASTLIC